MNYTVYIYDKIPATHVLAEAMLPEFEMVRIYGLIFVPTSYAATLGPPDDQVMINGTKFPAQKAPSGEPPGIEFDNKELS